MADEPVRLRTPEVSMMPQEVPTGEVGAEVEVEEGAEAEVGEDEGTGDQGQGTEVVEVVGEAAPVAQVQAPVMQVAVKPQKDRFTKEVEAVLEEDLTDLYLKLPPDKQKAFEKKGEETAAKVMVLLRKASSNAKKIFELIRAWLKMIPGVNKFFLEQEAKIKTDKLLMLAEEEHRRGESIA